MSFYYCFCTYITIEMFQATHIYHKAPMNWFFVWNPKKYVPIFISLDFFPFFIHFVLESANDSCFSPAYKFPSSVIIPKVSMKIIIKFTPWWIRFLFLGKFSHFKVKIRPWFWMKLKIAPQFKLKNINCCLYSNVSFSEANILGWFMHLYINIYFCK